MSLDSAPGHGSGRTGNGGAALMNIVLCVQETDADMARSLFCVCAPGATQDTTRLFKAILKGCIPITFFRCAAALQIMLPITGVHRRHAGLGSWHRQLLSNGTGCVYHGLEATGCAGHTQGLCCWQERPPKPWATDGSCDIGWLVTLTVRQSSHPCRANDLPFARNLGVPYEEFILNIQPDDYTQLNSKVQHILDSPKRLRHMQVILPHLTAFPMPTYSP